MTSMASVVVSRGAMAAAGISSITACTLASVTLAVSAARVTWRDRVSPAPASAASRSLGVAAVHGEVELGGDIAAVLLVDLRGDDAALGLATASRSFS